MTTADESGQLGGMEAIAFGLLVLIVGTLLISNAWGVIDAKSAASEAARQAARTYATAPVTQASEAAALASQSAANTLGEMGWSAVANQLTQGTFERCAVITWEVAVRVPAFKLPWLAAGPSFFTASAYDSQRVDPYRSGVPGDPAGTGPVGCGGGVIVPPTP
jgi:flavin-binding protein dodecin